MNHGCSTDFKTFVSCDWMSATIAHENKAQLDFLKAFDDLFPRKMIKGLHGYNSGLRWDNGAMMFWHTDKPQMGVHLQLSGDALRSLDAHGYDAIFLMNRLMTAKAKFTRVDIALDVMDSGLDIAALYALFEAGEYNGRAQGATVISSTKGGITMYVGAWKSERFYRVYNKGIESGVGGDWIRVELILKDKYAKSFMAQFIGNPSLERLGAIMKGTVKAMAEMRDRTWIDIVDGATEKVSLPKDIPNNTRAWLLNQVCSAIANYIIANDDTGILDDMQHEITERLKSKWK